MTQDDIIITKIQFKYFEELIDKNKKLKKQVSKLESLCSEIKRTIDKISK